MPISDQDWKTSSNEFKIKKSDVIKKDNFVVLTVIYELFDDQEFDVIYHILPSGILKVDASFIPSPEAENDNDLTIPRIGIRFRATLELHNVSYFGKGPEENYSDRCSAAEVGLYKTTEEELYYPYVRPQENGHHVDTRWLALSNDNKLNGLLIVADKLIEFNVLRNSVEDFDDQDQVDLPYQLKNFGKS